MQPYQQQPQQPQHQPPRPPQKSSSPPIAIIVIVGLFGSCGAVMLVNDIAKKARERKEQESFLAGDKSTAPKPVERASAPAKPEPEPPATPEEAIKAIAAKELGNKFVAANLSEINKSAFERLEKGDTSEAAKKKRASDKIERYAAIDYDIGTAWSETSAARAAAFHLQAIGPKVFDIKDVDVLEFRALWNLKDMYGNVKKEPVLKFTVSRSTAAKVNWQNVNPQKFGVILQMNGDGVFVHPVMRKGWNEFVND